MNAQWKSWIDFAVRCVIVVVCVYLVMALFFMADYRRMSSVLDSTETQLKRLDKQSQFLAALETNSNPDVLYHMAMDAAAQGNMNAAVQKMAMAIQISEFNAQKYKLTLSQWMGQK